MRGVNSVQLICSQRRHNADAKRRKLTAQMYNCCGGISFSFSRGAVSRTAVRHNSFHEVAQRKFCLTQECKSIVQQRATEGSSPFMICANLRASGHLFIQYAQVYQTWLDTVTSNFRRSVDPKQSLLIFANESKNFDVIFHQSSPFAVALSTSLGASLCRQHQIVEGFIDSTYKTNGSGLEFFVVLGTVLGTGFPLIYFFVEGGGKHGQNVRRKDTILGVFKAMHRTLDSFRPLFFFSDKDSGQLDAIKRLYGINPSLCLWHLKRAIKQKISGLRKEKKSVLSKEKEQALMDLITLHFNRHPFFDKHFSMLFAKEKAKDELHTFFSSGTESTLKDYLLRNWYDDNIFFCWGRRNASLIPLSKTTMMCESHWSLLKRLYLLPYNRPRVDLLLYVLDSKLLSKYTSDYHLLMNGRKKPSWWREFVEEWKRCATTTIRGIYIVDKDTWTCSCPAYLRSPFLLCKHLVAGADVPVYRDIIRRRHPPFLEIQREPNRFIPKLEGALQRHQNHAAPPQLCINDNSIANILSNEFFADSRESLMKNTAEAAREAKEVCVWMTEHISSLSETTTGSKQIMYINGTVLRNLKKYKRDIEHDKSMRRQPRTWSNANTMHNP